MLQKFSNSHLKSRLFLYGTEKLLLFLNCNRIKGFFLLLNRNFIAKFQHTLLLLCLLKKERMPCHGGDKKIIDETNKRLK